MFTCPRVHVFTRASLRRKINGSCIYHKWKSDGRRLDALYHPHRDEAGKLDEREQMDSKYFAVAQVDVVRLVLDRHQYNQQTIKELRTQTVHVQCRG